MLASAAVTTGLFVLGGVVVGGLLTGAVDYAFESRREQARVRVAMRLLEAELAMAGASADWRLDQGAWSPWDFASAQRSWNEYRADLARADLPADEWYAISGGFYAIDIVERRFSNKPIGTELDGPELEALDIASDHIHKGLNTLRRRQGLEDIARD